MRKTMIIIAIVIAAATAIYALTDSETTEAPSLTSATVARVIDGDTIVLSNGERVRLIGVDAPEIGTAGADEATAFVKARVLNRTVWLSSSGPDRDRFGRLRRYVWLQLPSNPQNPAEIAEKQLNALLVAYGHAQVMAVQ